MRRYVATPQTIAVRQVMADGIIAVAAKAKDWPLLHEAVDIKIEDQREFKQWWEGHVRRKGGDGGYSDSQERGNRLAMVDAETQSGITNQQVSRWGKWPKDAPAYHDKLVQAACRKAGLEPEPNRQTPNSGSVLYAYNTPAHYIEAPFTPPASARRAS